MNNKFVALTLSALLSVCFARWFAIHQILAVTPEGLNSYPDFYFILTIIKVSLTLLIWYAAANFVIQILSRQRIPSVFVALSYMPLLLVFIEISQLAIVCSVLSLQILILLCFLRRSDYQWLLVRYGLDAAVFALFTVVHFVFTTRFAPYNWKNAILVADGPYSEEIPVLAPVFKGYVLAKHFSFSSFDHSQWAGILNPPGTLNSPLLQLLTFIFNLPSVSYEGFHAVYMAVYFIMMILGSFGFYLFLRYAARVDVVFAILGGILYTFGGAPLLADVFTSDGGIFISSFVVVPYALLLITLTFEKKSYLLSVWAGAALAAQFFLSAPHPEGVIYSLLFYGTYTAGLFLFCDIGSKKEKFKLAACSIAAFFILSSYTIAPILYDRLTGNMYVFAHIGDIEGVNLAIFIPYFILFVVFAPMSTYILTKRREISPVFKSVLLLASVFLFIILFAHFASLIEFLIRVTHIGIHIWAESRIGIYFCASVLMVVIFGLDALASYVSDLIIPTLSLRDRRRRDEK